MTKRKHQNLSLGPLKVENVTQATIALLGNKGTGKTSTLKMACYQLSVDYPVLAVVVFDPLGVIRIKGFNRINVSHKDASNGAGMAKLLNKLPHERIIISFGDMLQKEQNQFTNDFFANWHAENCIIAIDEAHDFCPQSGSYYCDEVERAVRHWRNHGNGCGFILTSQRRQS